MNKTQLISKGTSRSMMLTAIAGLCIAGGAFAQQESKTVERRVEGSFHEPLEGAAHKTHREMWNRASSQNSTVMMTVIEGDQTYTLKMINDDVRAQINGKEVPQDRIVRKGSKIDILGEDGKVVHTFKVDGVNAPKAPVPPIPPVPPVPPTPRLAPQGQMRGFAVPAQVENPPPVMIGMLMDYSDEKGGIVVVRVFDGLPAEKGGLEVGDVITRIEGERVDGLEVIRDVLANKKPGEKLALVIEREDQTKELALDLVKYDAEAMAKARGEDGELMPLTEVEGFRFEGLPDNWEMLNSSEFKDDVKKALEQALDQVKKNSLNEAEKWKGDVVSSLQKALELVESSSKDMQLQLREFQSRSRRDAQGGPTMILRERPGQAFTIAPSPKAAEATAQTNAQLERLAESLEKLNKRLEEMEKKLEKK